MLLATLGYRLAVGSGGGDRPRGWCGASAKEGRKPTAPGGLFFFS